MSAASRFFDRAKSDRGFFDKEGRPIELFEWARLVEDVDYRSVAETEGVVRSQGGEVTVRTWWLGLREPCISVEIFGTAISRYGAWVEVGRWSTLASALDGHRDIVAKLEAGDQVPDPDSSQFYDESADEAP